MRRKLAENITSEYIAASGALHGRNRVMVYVEGYDDIPFWRSIFDEFESKERVFEITTPVRDDLAKGKKVVLGFIPQAGKNLILCVDSDFDYIFGDLSAQSRMVNSADFLVQTYTYSIENYLCYPPSLHSVCARATKRDSRIFDFDQFMSDYSRIIYPVFLWYVYAARMDTPAILPLADFRKTVRINFLNVEDNGKATLDWLERQVEKRLHVLQAKNKRWIPEVAKYEAHIRDHGVTPETTHLYMQGHTLFDNVVMTLVTTVCNALRKLAVSQILGSSRSGQPLNNELSSYNNVLTDVEEMIKSNTAYRSCELFKRVHSDITRIVDGSVDGTQSVSN